MRAIFISYRRNDAEGQAGRLFDDLTRHFGEDAVFMDVAAIEPGRDFRQAIDQQVAACSVLLAVMGKDWVNAKDESGARRLDDPMDFVRLETASALKRDIPVVPVLVQGARMPRAQELPEDLKELAFRNGVELTHARWDSDVQVLVKALGSYVPSGQAPSTSPPRSVPRQQGSIAGVPFRTIIAGALGALALVCGWYVWQRVYAQQPSSVTRSASVAHWQKTWTTLNEPIPHLGSDGQSFTNRARFLSKLTALDLRSVPALDSARTKLVNDVATAPAGPDQNYDMLVSADLNLQFQALRRGVRDEAISAGVELGDLH
jgi:hypothetical protein